MCFGAGDLGLQENVGTEMTERKAYHVQYENSWDDYSCIVFAETPGKAKSLGASELECEFTEISKCKRAPEFDKYAGTDRLHDRAYIENNWSAPCPKCERPCDEYTAVYDKSGDWLKSCVTCAKPDES